MSRSFTKAAVVAVTALSTLIGASSASATNWHSNGPGSFAAATPTALTTVVVRTNSPNGFGYNCDQGTLSGSVAGPTGPVSTSTWTSALTATPAFERCNIAGIGMAITGASSAFDASSYSGGVTSGTFRASWTATFATVCPFSVSIVAPATSSSTALTINPAGQSGTISWPNTTPCNNLTGSTAGGSASATLTGSTASTAVVYSYSGTAPAVTY
jgi:hypothetical protein